jgi:hypothetical protein
VALTVAYADLQSRGLAQDRQLNASGMALRERIERTDHRAQRPWLAALVLTHDAGR